MLSLRIIDSHTGGEPTRVVLEDQIALEGATMAERRHDFEHRFDHLRSGIVNEPRGSEVWVGALLTAPTTPDADCGVIFFNNAGYLGMCGHGTIGVVETLRHLGRFSGGKLTLDTPVGLVTADLLASGEVAIHNVTSYRHASNVTVKVEGIGEVTGDIGYGGNWFFIVDHPHFDVSLATAKSLTETCLRVRDALAEQGVTGADGAEIDHVEVEGPATVAGAHSKNFVLCPGGAYDRSPCGTGTSAKMACLFAGGKLAAGEWFLQESTTGSAFQGHVEPCGGGVKPTIVGRAFVTAESTLIFGDEDPIRWGLTP